MQYVGAKTYWGPITGVNTVNAYLFELTTAHSGSFLCQQRLTAMRPPGPTSPSGWMKFLRYYVKDGERRVVHVENRAADALPVDVNVGAFFVIQRADSGKIAVPGGFIDVGDGIAAGSKLADIGVAAAARELMEETGAVAEQFKSLGRVIRERITDPAANPPREYVTLTWPHLAQVAVQPLAANDDAEMAEGDDGLPPGWRYARHGIPLGLHFAHHAEIIQAAIDACSTKRFPKRVRRRRAFAGRDLAAVRHFERALEAVTRRDYDRIAANKTPILADRRDVTAVDFSRVSPPSK